MQYAVANGCNTDPVPDTCTASGGAIYAYGAETSNGQLSYIVMFEPADQTGASAAKKSAIDAQINSCVASNGAIVRDFAAVMDCVGKVPGGLLGGVVVDKDADIAVAADDAALNEAVKVTVIRSSFSNAADPFTFVALAEF